MDVLKHEIKKLLKEVHNRESLTTSDQLWLYIRLNLLHLHIQKIEQKVAA